MKKLPILIVTLLLAACGNSRQAKETNNSTTGQTTNDTVSINTDTPVHSQNSIAIDTVVANRAKLFLQQTFRDDLSKNLIDSISRKFFVFTYDLNGDGEQEIFAGLTGPYFCGSGGCTWYLLNANGKRISWFTVTKYPVFISNQVSNGWKDLIIESTGKYHQLKYKGGKYPSNPSLAPVFAGDTAGLTKAFDNTENSTSFTF